MRRHEFMKHFINGKNNLDTGVNSKINVKRKKSLYCALILVVMLVVSGLYIYSNRNSDTLAAWVNTDVDSNQTIELVELSGPSDTKTATIPTFSVSDVKDSTGTELSNKLSITGSGSECTVSGVGDFEPGSSFKLTATSTSDSFRAKNLKFVSSNTKVATVTQGTAGSCTVTIKGPGICSIDWTYTYERYYVETVTSVNITTQIDPDTGEITSEANTVSNDVYMVDKNSTISGVINCNVNPKIENSSIYIQPNDTMYIKTNIPDTVSESLVSATYTDSLSLISSLSLKTIDGFWYILVTSKDANGATGKVSIRVKLTDSGTELTSEAVDIIVTDEFGITPESLTFNCVSYKEEDGETKVVYPSKVLTLKTTNNTDEVTWSIKDSSGTVHTINKGDTAVDGFDGLSAVISGNTLTLSTTETFFDNNSGTSATFTVYARQVNSNTGTVYEDTSLVTVTRPVMDVDIVQSGTGKIVNSKQELYTEIGYSVNGNGVSVSTDRFGNDTDVLMAYLATLGDDTSSDVGTNGEAVNIYDYNYAPYNSTVTWSTSDPNVVSVGDISSSTIYSTCTVTAVGPGEATVQAVSDDGSFMAVVHYIVRPYPKTVSMKDTTINQKMGDSTSKQVTLIANVTTDDDGNDSDTPAIDDYLDTGLQWKISSGGSIASVDSNGIVTITGPGTIVVSATSTVDHNGFQQYAPWGQCTIIVEQPVERITITNPPEDPIKTGDTYALKTLIKPTNSTDQSVVWSSANESVVKVDEKGVVTAVGPGETTVRVQTNSGAKYDTCKFTVKQVAEGIKLNYTEAKVSRGSKLTLKATITPSNTTDKTVTWTSSNKSAASVSSKGVVSGLAVADDPIIITATTSNGKSAVCYITVTEPVTGIKLSPKKKTVWVGNTFKIKKVLYPLNNSSIDTAVTWTSSNKKVATVDKNGKVTPKAGGTATITCVTHDGGLRAKCVVTVKEKVRKINLNSKAITLEEGETYKLKATVLRVTATNRAIGYKTSNSKVATVDSNGKIKAVKQGSCKVTVYAKDGSKVKAVCKVTVIKKCTKLTLNKTYITLIAGYQYKSLKAMVYPLDATNRKLKWTSTNSSVVSVNKNNGTLFAEASGEAYIKVRTTDGSNLKKRCRVKVIAPVPITSLTISQSEITLSKGTSTDLEVRVIPTNTTSGVKWMTDDESIATVDSNGHVKAITPGTTTITAYCNEGIESQCTITVIQMNPTSIAIEQYDTYQLTVDGATAADVVWSSANANVCKVSTSGLITGVKPGSTVITGTYNGKKVKCYVTIKSIV